jgi:hypothetical protein
VPSSISSKRPGNGSPADLQPLGTQRRRRGPRLRAGDHPALPEHACAHLRRSCCDQDHDRAATKQSAKAPCCICCTLHRPCSKMQQRATNATTTLIFLHFSEDEGCCMGSPANRRRTPVENRIPATGRFSVIQRMSNSMSVLRKKRGTEQRPGKRRLLLDGSGKLRAVPCCCTTLAERTRTFGHPHGAAASCCATFGIGAGS